MGRLLLLVVATLAIVACQPAAPAPTPLTQQLPEAIEYQHNVSISPFPYDLTVESVEQVGGLVSTAGNLYTVQLDNGVPWRDADAGNDFSSGVMEEWERHRSYIGADQQVYLAIAPLQDDRLSWSTGFDGGQAPEWATWESIDLERLRTAYLNYVNRAIEYFQPTFLNIGVEAGDLAHNDPQKWETLAEVLADSYQELKSAHPGLTIGVSWSLPLLMLPAVLEESTTLIEVLDYVGISFYPYLDQFYSRLGGVDLPQQPNQWREPYAWLSANIDKPLAICETGYSSVPVQLEEFDLDIGGDPDTQSLYVQELSVITAQDDYLFTVFFLAVDYGALTRELELPAMELWQYTGFFDEDLVPKPAWDAYIRFWLGQA
ncbi:MAG: hypothetical protein ACK5KU_05495 [Beutenbergiaceae bacterium]